MNLTSFFFIYIYLVIFSLVFLGLQGGTFAEPAVSQLLLYLQ